MSQIDYTASVTTAANNAGIDPNLALAVMNAESSGNASAVSPKGAVGLFQLMPSSFPGVNINDPLTNIDTGVGYLAQLLSNYGGDTSLALAAYNAGPGNVDKYGGIPPFAETQNYVNKILSQLDATVSGASDSGFSLTDPTTGNVDLTSIAVIAGVGLVGAAILFKLV